MAPIIPFPNEAPVEGSENGASNEHPEIFMSDSDSLSEDEDHNGYEPLSQDPDNYIDNSSDLEEDSNFLSEDGPLSSGVNLMNPHSLLLPAPFMETETTDQQNDCRGDLKMDDDHIETIKSVMKSITLPESNLPQWVHLVPEEEWKAALLTQMSNRQKSYSTSYFGETSSKNNEIDSPNEVPR